MKKSKGVVFGLALSLALTLGGCNVATLGAAAYKGVSAVKSAKTVYCLGTTEAAKARIQNRAGVKLIHCGPL